MVESMDKLVKPSLKDKLRKFGMGVGSGIKKGVERYNEYNKPENRISRLKTQVQEAKLQTKLQGYKLQQSNMRQPLMGYSPDNSFFVKPKAVSKKKKRKTTMKADIQPLPTYQPGTPLEYGYYGRR